MLASAAADHFRAIVAAYSGWHWIHTDCTRRYETPATHRLGEVRAPTLVLVGERDVPDMRAIADTLEKSIPNARKVVLEEVGHMANLENPTSFNQTVLEFLTSIEGASRCTWHLPGQ